MNQKQIAEKIKEEKEVASTSEWNDRIYVNLVGYDKTFRGCRTHKVWIGTDGAVNFEEGKGTLPSAFCDAFCDLKSKYAKS